MAFGMRAPAGDFLPIVKFNSLSGRWSVVDRDQTGVNAAVDITDPGLQFAADFWSLQVGYIDFLPTGPVKTLVPYGMPLPADPAEAN